MNRNIDSYTKTYLNDYDFESILVKYRRKKVLEILNEYKAKNILEIGCGIDSIVNYYDSFNTFTIVEPSKEFCKTCLKETTIEKRQNKSDNSKNRSKDNKENNKNDNISPIASIKLYNDFIENKIDILKNNKFDFIILSCLLHEVKEPISFLNTIIQLMNNNTILHINVPNSNSFHLLWAYESKMINRLGQLTDRAKKLQQNTTFNLSSLKRTIKKCNLYPLESGTYFIKPFNHSNMSKCISNDILNDALLDGLYNLTKYMPKLGCECFVNCRKV